MKTLHYTCTCGCEWERELQPESVGVRNADCPVCGIGCGPDVCGGWLKCSVCGWLKCSVCGWLKCSVCGEHKEDVSERVDPFIEEVYGRIDEDLFCDRCYDQRRMDI